MQSIKTYRRPIAQITESISVLQEDMIGENRRQYPSYLEIGEVIKCASNVYGCHILSKSRHVFLWRMEEWLSSVKQFQHYCHMISIDMTTFWKVSRFHVSCCFGRCKWSVIPSCIWHRRGENNDRWDWFSIWFVQKLPDNLICVWYGIATNAFWRQWTANAWDGILTKCTIHSI